MLSRVTATQDTADSLLGRTRMSYVGWALVAMMSYGVTAIFLKAALRHIPPEVALVITNLMLVAVALTLALYRGESLVAHLRFGRPVLFVALAGLTLSLSIVSYYTALSRGPTSLVVPIFAMSFAVAGALGMLILGEDIKMTRVLGMLLAAGAVVLFTR